MKKFVFCDTVCFLKPRRFFMQKIRSTLWSYYFYSDGLKKYFGKKIDYDYWWQVYSDYKYAKKFLNKGF